MRAAWSLSSTDRRILALALPAFGALAAEPLYRLVDTAIVGRLGTAQLGGVAIAVAVLSLVISGANFLAYGTTERVARRLGANDSTAAADVGVQATWLALLIGCLFAPLLAVFAEPLCRVLGAEDDVLAFAVEYLRISAIGVPFVVVGLAAQGVQRGASDYRTSLVVLVAANVLNVVLEVTLVFGFDAGVAGAAWSTVIAQVAAGLALTWRAVPLLLPAARRAPVWSEMAPLLNAGRHLVLRVGSLLVTFTGATSIAARIDTATLAAHQIAMTMFLFLALSLDALAVPAQTLVADALGRTDASNQRDGNELDGNELDDNERAAGERDTAELHADERDAGRTDATDTALVVRRVVVLSIRIAAVIAVVLAAASPLIARGFSADDDVVSRATAALIVLAVLLLPGAVAFAYDGVLIGAGDYRFLGRAAVAALAAVVPLATAVVLWPASGIIGLWGALTLWMVLRAAINHVRTQRVLPALNPPVSSQGHPFERHGG